MSDRKGCIKMKISDMSIMGPRTSCVEVIGGLPWKFSVAINRTDGNTNSLSCFLYCNSRSISTLWSCKARVAVTLLSETSPGNNKKGEFTHEFRSYDNTRGYPNISDWETIVDNDECCFQVTVTVLHLTGYRLPPQFDFLSSPRRVRNQNASLIIEGVRVNVDTAFLALHSPYFSAMFSGDFVEAEKSEIPLSEVKREEFLELLAVVYPSEKPINAENCEYLLKLADRFEIDVVLNKAEQFLVLMKSDVIMIDLTGYVVTEKFSAAKKLVIAQTYQLPKLQDTVLLGLKKKEDIISLNKSAEHRTFNDATRSALYARVSQLI